MVRRTISRRTLSTAKLSGVTSPETTASPKPQEESIATCERSPSVGLSVNATPAALGWTIFWMPTLIAMASWSWPISWR